MFVCGRLVLNTSCCSEMLKTSIGSVNWHLENNELNLFRVYKKAFSVSVSFHMVLHDCFALIRLHTLFPPAIAG